MDNTTIEQKKNNRVHYLDTLRVLASFAVIVLHVSAENFGDYCNSQWVASNIYDSMTRWCVPVFVMISGALFLDPNRNVSYKTIFFKNIFRILTAFIFWSIVYAIYCHIFFTPINAAGLISEILIGHFHLWFLYMIIGLYLAVPILRQIAINKDLSMYFMLLSFIFAFCIPHIIDIIELSPTIKPIGLILNNIYTTFDFNIAAGFLGYFMLGYYLSNISFSKKTEQIIFILGIISFCLIAILTYSIFNLTHETCKTFYKYISPLVMLEAVAIFSWMKRNEIISQKINSFIRKFSKLSFGIYLVHMLVFYTLRSLGVNANIINPLFGIPAMSIAIFIISSITAYIVSKIPYINKYIL